MRCAARSPQGFRATEGNRRPHGVGCSKGSSLRDGREVVRLRAHRRKVVAACNGSNSRLRHVRPRGRPPHGMALVARPQRQGRNWQPQGRQEANVTATPSAVTTRRIRPTVTTCNARSRKAREPPRSMRWCQRRCDRGIRARDPDVCCADALFPREGAESSKATTPCGWSCARRRSPQGDAGLHHGPTACFQAAARVSPAALLGAATPGIACPTRRTDRASATALLQAATDLWRLLSTRVRSFPICRVPRPPVASAASLRRRGRSRDRWSNRGLPRTRCSDRKSLQCSSHRGTANPLYVAT